jgi:peptidoglycan-associated lipoprotein
MKRPLFTITAIILMSSMIAAGCSKKAVKSEMAGEGAEGAPKVEAVAQEPVKPETAEPTSKKEEAVKSEAISQAEAQKKAEPVVGIKGVEDIFFDYDRSSIREEAKQALENNASYFKANKNGRIVVEGHCDERGTSEYNIALGERRALAAKKYLTDLGIDPSIISIISYGKEKPFCEEHNEQCWQENRRAHFLTK